MTRRLVGSMMLAAAALASIATSAPQRWVLEDFVEIPPTQIQASAGFAITAEARGPRNGHLGGDVEVFLELGATSDNLEFASVTVTLTPEADPGLREVQQVSLVPGGAPARINLFGPAWDACQAGPCFEDFLLEISNATPNTSISVTGSVRATLNGGDPSPEPDSEVVVELTPL